MPDWLNKAGGYALSGLKAATTPLISPEAGRAGADVIEGHTSTPTQGGFFDALGAIPDVVRNLREQPAATIRGYIGGGVEGLAGMSDPLTIAALPFGGEGKAVGSGARAGVRAAESAMPAMAGLERAGSQVSRAMPPKNALKDLEEMFALYGDDVAEAQPVKAAIQNNASGESAASLESLGRRAWEAKSGRKAVRVQPGGKRTPFIGEPGDIRLNPGERMAYELPDGTLEWLTGR
jgi:hypothetical protein